MWQAMRILSDFSLQDLLVQAKAADTHIAESEALHYCRKLCQVGYLMQVAQSRPKRWYFINSRYSGPSAPQIQRSKQVFDANLNKVVWPIDTGDNN